MKQIRDILNIFEFYNSKTKANLTKNNLFKQN